MHTTGTTTTTSELAAIKCARLQPLSRYQCYVRPWIRLPLCTLLVFALFSVCGNVCTFQSNRFRALREQQAEECRRWVEGKRSNSAAAAEAGVGCTSLLHPLPDSPQRLPTIFDPPSTEATARWIDVIDFQPLAWVLLMLLALAIRRDLVRYGEVVALEVILLGSKGIAQVLTTIPDSNGEKRERQCREECIGT
jgi:hypothetical protein